MDLENGGKIRMVLADGFTVGVDTMDEAQDAEDLLRNDLAYAT